MLDRTDMERSVQAALAEDVGEGDITSRLVVPEDVKLKAEIIARSEGVLAGIPVVESVFFKVDPEIRLFALKHDGERVSPGSKVFEIEGSARSILAAERVALNFLQHLSGVATLTERFVGAIAGSKARIFDTRKTLPGLRALEKYAVAIAGGSNHRSGLFDGVLIKDNHLKITGGVGEAVIAAKKSAAVPVEVEVESIDELRDALEAGADIILLDNMVVSKIAEAVSIASGRAILEASGGITLDNVAKIADTGVDRISVGSLTQGAPPLDLALEVVEVLV